jgi:hypothetical protein
MMQSLQEIVARADELYAARERIENVRAAFELLQGADAVDNFETAWRTGRCCFFLGQEAQSVGDSRAFHATGARVCARAAQMEALRVEGHFWLGVNLALLAQLENPLSALKIAWRARRALACAVHIDAAYHAAGPLRVLARLQHKLPRFLGGGSTRARANFEKAIYLAPTNTVTRIYFAEMLLEQNELERARRELEAIINAPHDPAWAFEATRDKLLAREMMKKIKGKSER